MKNTEYEKFNSMVDRVLKVSHAEIKAKLEEEKKQKTKRKAVGGKDKATSSI